MNGKWVKAQLFDEVIHVKGQPDEHLQLVVTRHGPIVRREAGKVLRAALDRHRTRRPLQRLTTGWAKRKTGKSFAAS